MACDADADCAPAPGATGTVCHGGVRGGRPCSTDDTDPSTGCPGASCPGCCHGTCRDLAACTGGGGTCDGHPISPAGPGKIDAIDFGTASDALIDDVWVHDHQGGTSFAVKGTLRASSNGKKSVSYPVALSWAPFPIVDGGPDTGAAVAGRVESCDLVAKTTGLSVVGRDTKVRDNRIAVNGEGASYGIDAHTAGGYAATIEGNTVTGFRTYGIWAYAASNVIGNWLYSDSPTCTGLYVEAYHDNVGSNYVQVKGQCVAGNPSTALNVTFAGNRCFGGGPQVHIKGPGWIVTDNYLAWAGGGEVIRYSGGGHPLIANNLVHTSGATDVCHGGARDGQPCSSDTARAPAVCPGSTCPGCCYSSVSGIRFVDTGTPFSSVNIAGNSFLHVGIGVDMSGVTTTGVGDVSITGNQFTSVGRTAVRFPSVPTLVTGALVGNNHFASGVATTENWDWRMGVLSLNGPLEPSDDDVTTLAYVNNRSGGTIAAGDAVEVDAGGDDAVRLARAGTGTAVAIMLEPCASGSVCKIARAGTTACNVEAGASVGRGDRLKVGDTAGKMTVAAAVEPAVAVATTAGAGSVRCLVGALAPGGSAARPIVFTQQVAPGCRYGSDSSRAVTLRGFPVTGLTGDRTAVLTVTLQQSDQAAGSEKFRFWIYDNGATGCPASCTAATPSGRDCGQACGALAPAAGLDHAMNGGEGQSTVVTMTWVDPQTRAGVNNYCLVAAEEGGAAPHALDSVQLVAVEYP